MENTSTKTWYQSKSIMSAILKMLAGMIVMYSQYLAAEINAEVFLTGAVSSLWGIADIIIRFKTNQPLTLK